MWEQLQLRKATLESGGSSSGIPEPTTWKNEDHKLFRERFTTLE